MMHQSMPDLCITVEDMVAEGDTAVCRRVWRWTDHATGTRTQFHGFVRRRGTPRAGRE